MNTVTRFRESYVWDDKEEKLYAKLLDGYKPILHLFSGRSNLGDVRVDREPFPQVTHRFEVKPSLSYRLPFRDGEFDATIFDPPWINQYFVWTSFEVPRVTRRRIVAITGCFWWEPHKKFRGWRLSKIYVLKRVSPVTKLIFVYDKNEKVLDKYLEGYGNNER